jgi:hypothetical protein
MNTDYIHSIYIQIIFDTNLLLIITTHRKLFHKLKNTEVEMEDIHTPLLTIEIDSKHKHKHIFFD